MYNQDATRFSFAPVTQKLSLVSALVVLLGVFGVCLAHILGQLAVIAGLALAARCILAAGIALALVTIILYYKIPDTYYICNMVRRGLFYPPCGNPLHMRDGELLPAIRCKKVAPGQFDLTITTQSVTVETIINASSSISSMLGKKFEKFSITQTNADLSYNYVTFRLEDVTIDRSLTFDSAMEMQPESPTLLSVQTGTKIDLTTSGSMLISGKTRSGKTTGIIALLLQVLLAGRDNYNSEVLVIDPKQAELSQLPYVVTLDKDGEATQILAAIEHFADTIVRRQQVLNELSVVHGDVVHWWDAEMHPSFLFVDEYVAFRSLLPRRVGKDNPSYSLERFDGLIKRIVTMGASAGCFAIISIAEASVEEGGLPSMLRSAMSTRVLFRPTLAEGRLLWGGSNEKLKNFAVDRVYGPGDAWFSSTDGIHDNVSFVHFPHMEFPVYQELGRLLRAYYGDKQNDNAPPRSEAEAAAVSENMSQ